MRHIKEESFIKSMCRKMAPPLGMKKKKRRAKDGIN
jgi:hypothetical protein